MEIFGSSQTHPPPSSSSSELGWKIYFTGWGGRKHSFCITLKVYCKEDTCWCLVCVFMVKYFPQPLPQGKITNTHYSKTLQTSTQRAVARESSCEEQVKIIVIVVVVVVLLMMMLSLMASAFLRDDFNIAPHTKSRAQVWVTIVSTSVREDTVRSRIAWIANLSKHGCQRVPRRQRGLVRPAEKMNADGCGIFLARLLHVIPEPLRPPYSMTSMNALYDGKTISSTQPTTCGYRGFHLRRHCHLISNEEGRKWDWICVGELTQPGRNLCSGVECTQGNTLIQISQISNGERMLFQLH